MLSEADLIVKLKKGDVRAQQQCFEQLAPVLLSTARRYTPEHLDPLDIVQDAFIRIFEKIHQFDQEKGNLEVWARRIVINLAISQLRKRIRFVDLSSYEHVESSNEMDVLNKMTLDEVFSAIEKLPDVYKQVFSMYEIEGFSHKEISDMLGIKEVSSRSNLHRAKQKLDEIFGNYLKEKKWMMI